LGLTEEEIVIMVASSLDLDDFTNTIALPENLLDWFTVDYDESKAPEE
jgi:hypothetical protein